MNTTTIKLLEAAAEVAGGPQALAERLDISETLLGKFLDGSRELPDPLLLRAVDLILADRDLQFGLSAQPASSPPLPT
jgi:hypothetical protein